VVNGTLTAFDTYAVKNVEVTSKKAFKAVHKKVQKDTESVCMNLEFIDSEANRELAVGYGYLSRADLNYALSYLENNNNEFCSYSDIFELIRGQLSGITVSNNEVFVRGGHNSFSPDATMALYVVDSQPVSDLEWLQPCQINSINVFKDSNAAIYGTRGDNGVVLIETMK